MKLSFLSYELMKLRSVKEINRSHATDYLRLDKSPHRRKPRTKYESAFLSRNGVKIKTHDRRQNLVTNGGKYFISEEFNKLLAMRASVLQSMQYYVLQRK